MATAVEPVIDDVTADWRPLMHQKCSLCYPVNHPGILAICGEPLLGMPPLPDSVMCGGCGDDAALEHFQSEHPNLLKWSDE